MSWEMSNFASFFIRHAYTYYIITHKIQNMKTRFIKFILAAIILKAAPAAANAQLGDILNAAKQALGKNSTASTITDAVANILGTDKVTQSKLVGTWTYSAPCVVLDSEGTLNKIGGTVVSSKIEKTLQTGLTKAGIKAGALSVTFSKDSTFTFVSNNRSFPGTYQIDGSDVILTFTRTGKSVAVNTKITSGSLQMAMDATKMLTIVSNITTKASAYSSQLKTVSALLSKYKGLHLGLKYSKKK